MEKTVVMHDIQTAPELLLAGSTLEVVPVKEEDWHKPQGVLIEVLTIEEAIKQRKAVGHFESGMLSSILGFEDKSVSVGFSDIDENTGMTHEDPKIIGLWNEERREIEKIEGRDLTQEAYGIFRKSGIDLHLRETGVRKEREDNSGEQKG